MTTATGQAAEILCRIDHLRDLLQGQVLVSQNRWVDHCLDLFNLVEQPPLRRVVKTILSDVRNLCSVEARWLSDQLEMLAAAVEIESAFDGVASPAR